MEFEWDEAKNRANQAKHGIAFEVAKLAFFDPCRKTHPDKKHSQREPRYFCYGRVAGRILTVRYTLRAKKIRIFGASEWRVGRKKYEQS
ncbi:MAG: BrnT family toxin [Verrucomicrobiales bacterium]|nr:BrnT family toxin [Verrucomicrobiales bacterium]